MKKKFFFFSFCLLFFVMQAQEQTFTKPFDHVFRNVSRAEATTGILYERVIPFARLYNYNSTLSPVDTSNFEHFKQAYFELYNATFIPVENHFSFDIDHLKSLTKDNEMVIDMGILHFRFNTMDSAVAYQKLYFDADSVLFENNTVTASLYVERTALVASPLKNSVEVGTTTFRFLDILKFDNTGNPIVKLNVDFDDGFGFREVTNDMITIFYAEKGTKTLSFEAILINGDRLLAYSIINCTTPCRGCDPVQSGWKYLECFEGNNAISAKISPPNPYDGGTFDKEKGEVWIYYASSDKELRKPVLIVDGFDPNNYRTFEKYNGEEPDGKSIWEMLENGTDDPEQNMGFQLLRKGYDLVVLDLPEGGIYIEQNAMVCIEVINLINRKLAGSGSEEEIVVVGPSMGGQISRYALAYMEQNPGSNTNNGNHNCRLWLSLDSPHQGANISIGAQALMKYFSGLSDNIKWKYESIICCKAAKQLLLHHRTNDGNPSTLHTTYYNKLKTLGYPSNLRKVAIANGSFSNTTNGEAGDLAFSGTVWWPIFIGIPLAINLRLRNTVDNGESKIVFNAVYYVLGFPIPDTYEFTNNTGKCSPDAAPGGSYNTYEQVRRAVKKIGGTVGTNQKTHCFMPIPSVLDAKKSNGDEMDYCTNIVGVDLVAQNRTPFQAYWGSTDINMEHIEFNNSLIIWLFDEIDTYIEPGKRTINYNICGTAENVQYTVHFPTGKTSPVTWTCSSNLQIVSGQGTQTITLKPISAGEGWVEAELTGTTILTHNKQLKRYHIKVNYEEGTPPFAPTTITGNPTWNTPYIANNDINIPTGQTLTIQNTSLYIAAGKKITIQPGAKLIIDNASLTKSCDDPWQGIVVKGDPTKPMTEANQGYVQIKNNGGISNAMCAIDVNGGGMVNTYMAHFSQNKTGIKFSPLASGQSGTSGSLGYTTFYAYPLANYDAHIKMDGCGNVYLGRCTFSGISNNFEGIIVKDASLNGGEIMLENVSIALQTGGTLTLTDTLYFKDDATLTVYPKGKLIVNGGRLDNGKRYEYENFGFWQGITVKGDPTKPLHQTYQGYVEIKNGGKIANAITGITVQAGGLVNVNNAHFLNNKTGVKFEPLNSVYSGTTGVFSNANFVINSNFIDNLTSFSSHINAQSSGNISISGCNFSVPPSIASKNSIVLNHTPSNWANTNNLQYTSVALQSGSELTHTGTMNFGNSKILLQSSADFTNQGTINCSGYSNIFLQSSSNFSNKGAVNCVGNSNISLQSNSTLTNFGIDEVEEETEDPNVSFSFINATIYCNGNSKIALQSGSLLTNKGNIVCEDNASMSTQSNAVLLNKGSINCKNNTNISLQSGSIFDNKSNLYCKDNTLVKIESNSSFAHTGNMYSSGSSGITVHPTGELIVDGGKLTYATQGDFWQGITVIGKEEDSIVISDSLDAKNGSSRGYVELKNLGRIENAICGINSKRGGIIETTNAYFINNKTGVKFEALASGQSGTTGSFSQTSFELNSNFSGNSGDFNAHLVMDTCGTILFSDCSFSSSAAQYLDSNGIIARKSAIYWNNDNILDAVPLNLVSGATLNLTGTIYSNMKNSDGGIKVFSPSKLIIDGGTLTSIPVFSVGANTCGIPPVIEPGPVNPLWHGVTIYADESNNFDRGIEPNDSLSIVPINQINVQLKNGGKIENAVCGIKVYGGGIVSSNNAHFINNKIGVKFLPLTDNNPFSSGYFNLTNFVVNNNYIGNEDFDSHLIMENSGSVKINNSIFTSDASKNNLNNNNGIVAFNTDVIIDNHYGIASPVANMNFSGFRKAISATNSGTFPVFKTLNSKFQNNLYGIEINGIHNIEIANNEFHLLDMGAIGVSVANATGYKIEENSFFGNPNLASFGTQPIIGLYISDSGTEENEVYLNSFTDLSIGQLFFGINGDEKFETGLQSLCNTFSGLSGRITDIYVGRYPVNLTGDRHLIRVEQGSEITPAGNQFHAPDRPITNITNNSLPAKTIIYYCGRTTFEIPRCNNATVILAQMENSCEARNNNGENDDELLQNISSYSTLNDNYFNSIIVKSLKNEKIYDDLRFLFSYRNHYIDHLSIIETYLAEKNYQEALVSIAKMYHQFEITEEQNSELQNLQTYTHWLQQLVEKGGNIYQLSNNEVADLVNFVSSAVGRSKVFAHNILCKLYEICIEDNGEELAVRDLDADANDNAENLHKSMLSVSSACYKDLEKINIYPNPTTGELTIENGQLTINNVEIFDVYGRKTTPPFGHPSLHGGELSHSITLNISDLPTGIYFVKISTEVGDVVKKVVKY